MNEQASSAYTLAYLVYEQGFGSYYDALGEYLDLEATVTGWRIKNKKWANYTVTKNKDVVTYYLNGIPVTKEEFYDVAQNQAVDSISVYSKDLSFDLTSIMEKQL